MLDTIYDKDCISREFDVGYQSFNTKEAVSILSKCKLLVLQNVFDKTLLTEYHNKFTNYINAINSSRISTDGCTRRGENL